MAKTKYKYIELYRGHKIMIRGSGGEWWWEALIVCNFKNSHVNSPSSYYSIESAISGARKYINKKI